MVELTEVSGFSVLGKLVDRAVNCLAGVVDVQAFKTVFVRGGDDLRTFKKSLSRQNDER
jgi:hypothetical protein